MAMCHAFFIVNYSGVFGIPERMLEYAKRTAYHQELHVAAEKRYPEDYDFSIVFDTVENRKIRHDMERNLWKS